MNRKVKASTIARIAALAVALVNECLIVFGQDILPFTENMAYQIVSLAFVIVAAAINAWYNNDISQIALLCGGVFDALSDKKITEEEIEKILRDAEEGKKSENNTKLNMIVLIVNNFLASLKNKNNKE